MEIWKDIKGFEGCYQISNYGNVRSLDRVVSLNRDNATVFKRGRGLKSAYVSRDRDYLAVKLSKNGKSKTTPIHKLMALTFIDSLYREKGLVTNHKDGNKSNNHLKNIEVVTHRENNIHAIENGLRNVRGEKSGMAKLTNSQVIQIRELASTTKRKDLAKMFNVSMSNIGLIIKRKLWKHL